MDDHIKKERKKGKRNHILRAKSKETTSVKEGCGCRYQPELGDYGAHSGGPPAHWSSLTTSAPTGLVKLFAVLYTARMLLTHLPAVTSTLTHHRVALPPESNVYQHSWNQERKWSERLASLWQTQTFQNHYLKSELNISQSSSLKQITSLLNIFYYKSGLHSLNKALSLDCGLIESELYNIRILSSVLFLQLGINR